jgi:hypothetical protein
LTQVNDQLSRRSSLFVARNWTFTFSLSLLNLQNEFWDLKVLNDLYVLIQNSIQSCLRKIQSTHAHSCTKDST